MIHQLTQTIYSNLSYILQSIQANKDSITAALYVFILSLSGLMLVRMYLIKKLRGISQQTDSRLDDILTKAVAQYKTPFYVLAPFYLSLTALNLHNTFTQIVLNLTIVVAVFYTIRAINVIVEYSIDMFFTKFSDDHNMQTSIKRLSANVVKVVVWVLGIGFVMQNLGVRVTTILGGLGIGGIALAFAVQNVLSDLFAFFSIYFDKPFETGDLLVIGDDVGTVEKIGIKSTRLKSIRGEELVFANSYITSNKINNFKKMEKRRVDTILGITYETPKEKIKQIPEILKNLISKEEEAEFELAVFKDFGASSIDIELIYYVLSNDFNLYMSVRDNINNLILEEFANQGIGFAYPTQVVHLKNHQ